MDWFTHMIFTREIHAIYNDYISIREIHVTKKWLQIQRICWWNWLLKCSLNRTKKYVLRILLVNHFYCFNYPWSILFCLAKHRALWPDYIVLTNKERAARVTSPRGFAARQFLVMSHTDDKFPFRQYNYHDQLVARPDNYHDYCPEI